jgi:small-conductance mechanosensitive channel
MNEFLARPLLSLGSTEITMGTALLLVVVVLVTLLVARWVRRLTVRHFEPYDPDDEVAVKSTAKLIAAVIVFIGLDLMCHILGIRLTSMLAAGGFLALGIGLAAKNVVANFISGVILRVDRTIRPGDIIEVHDQWMRIEKLGVRMTYGTTAKGEAIMIPNATVAQSVIKNLTRQNRLYQIRSSLNVPYSADLEKVRQTLEDTVANLEWRSSGREPSVLLAEFTRFNVIYKVLVWIDDVETAEGRESDLNEALWQSLDKAGIDLVAT